MTRNIYVNVQVQRNGKIDFFFIVNNQLLYHDPSCDAKNPDPHLQLFNVLRKGEGGLEKIKVISFILSVLAFPTFDDYYKFRQNCYKLCQENGIFYYCPRPFFIDCFMALSQTQTLINEGEKVTVFKIDPNSIIASTCIREKNHFRCLYLHGPSAFSPTLKWKKEFMNGIVPEKVIFMPLLVSTPNELKKMFDIRIQKTCVYTVQQHEKAVMDMALHAMGEKINQYYIREIYGLNGIVHDDKDNDFITVESMDILPFEKSVIVDVDPSKTLTYSVLENQPSAFSNQIKLSSFKCKKVKASLKIDINGFYDFKVEPFNEQEKLFERMSKVNICDSISSFKKARIIFDKQNFTVFVGDENGMQVIKDADGNKKIPIYIAFIDQKPIFGNAAKEFCNTKPKSVVFDLINLSSISNADIMSPKWGFKLSKEEKDGTLMVTMDTVDGEKKSSVDFLLALILKDCLKIIKSKTGKRMEKLEIGFDGFTPNEILKKNFVEAGKLKKVDIVFV